MEKFLKKFKKNWVRVWLIIVTFLCCMAVVFAAYTEVSSVKRVVSTTSSPGDPFSSNCMHTTISSRRLTATEFPVSVCNFDQDFPKDYCTTEIIYNMTAELKVKIDSNYYAIAELENLKNNDKITDETYRAYLQKALKYGIRKLEDDKNGALSEEWQMFSPENEYKVLYQSDRLRPNRSSTDIYSVKIDDEDLRTDDTLFFVFVEAKPSSGVLSTLSARLYGTLTKEVAASWSGSILEQNCDTIDYDFYNYVITGSGIGTLDIYWDPTKVSVNKYFLEQNNLNAEDADSIHEGWKKITINVDSTKKNRYEFQLFKAEKDSSFLIPSAYITCIFTKSSE